MINKSKIRITGLLFASLMILLAVTVGIIYLLTSHQLSVRNTEMLSRYEEQYWLHGNPEKQEQTQSVMPPEDNASADGKPSTQSYVSATFYSVAFLGDGTVDITNSQPSAYTDEQLTSIAQSLLDQSEGYGTTGTLAYLISVQDGTRLITLMDNSALDESKQILLHNTFLYGICAIPFLALLSWIFAGWTLRPMKKSYEKQKQFIADAGHELKTPISTISANLELLSRDTGDNRWLSNIRYENDRMGELVHQLLNLAQLDSISLPMEQLDFSRLVTTAVLPFESRAYELSRKLDYEIPDGIMMTGNESQLAQLVSILLDNGIDHCCKGGTVRVVLESNHGKIILSVSNNGTKIPAEQCAHLFERFYRGEEARTQNGHYGLGLSIAKAVTDAHHGTISVKSNDDLTTFTVELPDRLKPARKQKKNTEKLS
jgi:signal transduction histidine kinase